MPRKACLSSQISSASCSDMGQTYDPGQAARCLRESPQKGAPQGKIRGRHPGWPAGIGSLHRAHRLQEDFAGTPRLPARPLTSHPPPDGVRGPVPLEAVENSGRDSVQGPIAGQRGGRRLAAGRQKKGGPVRAVFRGALSQSRQACYSSGCGVTIPTLGHGLHRRLMRAQGGPCSCWQLHSG